MMKKQTIERMVSTLAVVMVMVGLLASAAMAQEQVVRDHRDGSEKAAPVVRDHRDDATSTTIEEKEEEEPYKNPGIRQCDLTPVECEEDTEEQKEEEPYKDPDDVRQCFIKPYCEDTEDQEEEEEPYKDPGIRQCDLTPVECEEDTDKSGDSAGVVRDHRDGGGSKDEEAASAPGGVKVGASNPSVATPKEAVSAPADEAGQTANSGINGDDTCPFDGYMYIEELDVCFPESESNTFLGQLLGDAPLPDSLGGYLGLAGNFVQDPLLMGGFVLDVGLGYVGDAMVEFGEDGGPIGWVIQGTGYTLGFLGDASGALGTGLGEAADAVAEGVGEVVDAIGDAGGAVYDEIASWF